MKRNAYLGLTLCICFGVLTIGLLILPPNIIQAACNAPSTKAKVNVSLSCAGVPSGSMDTPGIFIRLNNNDNAGGVSANTANGNEDLLDVPPGGMAFPDPDLVKIVIKVDVVDSGTTFYGETVKFYPPRRSGVTLVKVWSDSKKTALLTEPIEFTGVNGPSWTKEVWIEGVSPGAATDKMAAWFMGEESPPVDSCVDFAGVSVVNVSLKGRDAWSGALVPEHLEHKPPQGIVVATVADTPACTIQAEDLGPGVSLTRTITFVDNTKVKYATQVGGVFPTPPSPSTVPATITLPASGDTVYQLFRDTATFASSDTVQCKLQVTTPYGTLMEDIADLIPLKVVFSKSANHKYGYDKHESMTSTYNNGGTITTSTIQPLPEHDIICGKQGDAANTFVHVDIYGCLPNQVTFSVDDASVAKIGATPAPTAQVAAPSSELKIWPQSPDKASTIIKAQVGSPPVTVAQIEMWTYREPIPPLEYWHVTVNDVGAVASIVNVGSLIATADIAFRQAVVKGTIANKDTRSATYSGEEIKNDICDVYGGMLPGKEVEKIVDVLKLPYPTGIGYSDLPQVAILVVHVKKLRQVVRVMSLSFDSVATETTVVTAGDPTFAIQSASIRLEGWNNPGGVPVIEPRSVAQNPVGSGLLYSMKISGPALPADFVAPQCAIVGPAVAGLAIPPGPFFNGGILVADRPTATEYESLVFHEIGHTGNLGDLTAPNITWNDLGPNKNLMYGATYTPPAGSAAPNELRNRPLPLYRPPSGAVERQWDRVKRTPSSGGF